MAHYETTYSVNGKTYSFLTEKGCPKKFGVILVVSDYVEYLLDTFTKESRAISFLNRVSTLNFDVSAKFLLGERIEQTTWQGPCVNPPEEHTAPSENPYAINPELIVYVDESSPDAILAILGEGEEN
jgi:hypothetical protein